MHFWESSHGLHVVLKWSLNTRIKRQQFARITSRSVAANLAQPESLSAGYRGRYTSNETRNQYWETNDNKITAAIAKLMQDYGRMPAKREIATETGLSRKTIHQHLKKYSEHDLYIGQVEQFRFMADTVLAKIFKFAINGDIRAKKTGEISEFNCVMISTKSDEFKTYLGAKERRRYNQTTTDYNRTAGPGKYRKKGEGPELGKR
jgi:hypothetical protein